MIFGIDEPSRADNVAVIDPVAGQEILYRELVQEVVLRRDSLPPVQPSGEGKLLLFVFCRNRVGSLVSYLAGLESGHAVALLDASLNAELRSRLIERYRPELIACDDAEAEFPGYRAFAPQLWRTESAESSGAIHPDLCLLLPTSGTTGAPKFVRLTRRNLESNSESICEALAIRSEDRAIANLPIHYSYGMSIINTHLTAGAALMLTEEGLTSEAFWAQVRKWSCTSFAGVPYTYQMLRRLQLDKLNVPAIHTCTQAGGKLDDKLIALFHELMVARGGRFFVMYGQTEAGPRIAVLPHEALPAKLGSAGLPVPGGKFTISEDGELIYEGPNVMMGYAVDRSGLAAGDEMGGRLPTGDRASLDADGFLYIHGRTGREVKLFGLRINLDEIENMLRSRGPTAIVGGTDKLVIFCEYGDDEAYRTWAVELAEKLNLNFRAFTFRRVDALPTTSAGKIDYPKLAESAK